MKGRILVLTVVTVAAIGGLILTRGGGTAAESGAETVSLSEPATQGVETPPTTAVTDPAIQAIVEAELAEPRAEQTEAGARVAAVRLLEVTESIVQLSPADAAAAQRSLSTQLSGGRLAAEVEEQMIDLVASAPGGITLWVTPLSARSAASDDGFDVSIWYAEVLAIDSTTVVDNWRTVTYSLAWEDGGWKVDDMVSLSGPVPTRSASLVPTSASAVGALLSGYSDDGLTP